MTTASATTPSNAPAIDRRRLFIISVLALVTAGMAFSLRSSIAPDLQTTFLDPIDKAKSAGMLGQILGISFLGFAFSIAIGSLLLDLIGMRLMLGLSSLCFLGGSAAIITTPHTAGAYDWLYVGCLLSGLGWGLVETVINPLTATLYPADKTHKLNVLHAWWPGGIIIGGLLGLLIGEIKLDWQVKYGLILLPALVFGIMAFATRFPPTERAAAGVSTKEMVGQIRRPLFLVFFFSMFLTAASELAPGQWVNFALTRTVHMDGIWLLIYISGLMFFMRHFAGALSHRMSPVGVLWVSCLLAAIGLVILGRADSPISGLLAATVWGTGVCFMWPTMLAASSERFPRGGALLMGLMGTAGTTSIWFFLPKMGSIYDNAKIALANGQEAGSPPLLMLSAIRDGVLAIFGQGGGTPASTAAFDTLSTAAATDPAAKAHLEEILVQASRISFEAVAVLPAMLLVVFGAIWLYDRSKGGYRPERI